MQSLNLKECFLARFSPVFTILTSEATSSHGQFSSIICLFGFQYFMTFADFNSRIKFGCEIHHISTIIVWRITINKTDKRTFL